MKINRQGTSSKKKIIVAAAALILIAGAVGTYFFMRYQSDQSTHDSINYDKPTNEQKEAGGTTKENSVNANGDGKSSTSGSDQAASPVPQTDGRGKVDATMTAANQNGSILQIRFDIGAVTSDGTCTLTLKKGATTVTRTSGVQALAGSSTCKGFDIATSDLAPGTWQVALSFENSSLIASTTGSAIVQ